MNSLRMSSISAWLNPCRRARCSSVAISFRIVCHWPGSPRPETLFQRSVFASCCTPALIPSALNLPSLSFLPIRRLNAAEAICSTRSSRACSNVVVGALAGSIQVIDTSALVSSASAAITPRCS